MSVMFIVHMGTRGLARGARDVVIALLDELKRRGIQDCQVMQADLNDSKGVDPVVDILIPGQPALTCERVTPEAIRRLVARHLVRDCVAVV